MDSEDDATAARWKDLVLKAKKCHKHGKFQQSLELFREAFDLRPSDKLKNRIQKLEEYMKADEDGQSSSDDETSDKMVHVGNGFYLSNVLYDKLYAHQRQGVLFLYGLFKKKKGGVLGDDMGLGKTIQVIALLSGLFDASKVESVLIVCPVAVICNWAKELEKWAPGIPVFEFHSETKQKRESELRKLRRQGGVCLTSYGVVINNTNQLGEQNGRDYVWDYVILDEGHKIKNAATQCSKAVHTIRAKNRLVLTGTPVMNNLKELWALFDWVHEGKLLGTAKTFAMEYETPIMTARQKDATAGEQRLGHEMSVSLNSIIQPFFFRRTKADVGITEASAAACGDRKGQAPLMPTMTRKNDLVVWLFLSDIQKDIYTRFLELPEIKALLNDTKSPLVGLTVLKKICDHPRLMTNQQCLELGLEMPAGIDIGSMDRAVAADPSLFDIGHVSDKLLLEESGKMIFVVELMENLRAQKHRCLVFSSSRRMLDIVQKLMKNRGHKMCRLDGTIRSKEQREEIINRFMKDQSFSSFLLTTQVGGIGLTLTAADRVIVIDPSWNPAVDSQAVDRAFRIGQTKDVVVYRLITCGSIEEKIYRRQVFKDSVMRQTTGDTKNPFRYFSKQDLRELFILDDTTRSETQVQLAELHRGLRKSDTQLDEHIAFLYSLDIFGVSDHDLMFAVQAASIVEGEGDMEEMGEQFVMQKVSQAQEKLFHESKENEMFAEQHGKYLPKVEDTRWGAGGSKAQRDRDAGVDGKDGRDGTEGPVPRRPKGSSRQSNMYINDDNSTGFSQQLNVINSSDEEEKVKPKGRSNNNRRIVDSDEEYDVKSKQFFPNDTTLNGTGQLDDSISQLHLNGPQGRQGPPGRQDPQGRQGPQGRQCPLGRQDPPGRQGPVTPVTSEDNNKARATKQETSAAASNQNGRRRSSVVNISDDDNTASSDDNQHDRHRRHSTSRRSPPHVDDDEQFATAAKSPAPPTPYAVKREALIFSPRMDKPLVACELSNEDPEKTVLFGNDSESEMNTEEQEPRDVRRNSRHRRRSSALPTAKSIIGRSSSEEDRPDEHAEMPDISGEAEGDGELNGQSDLAAEETVAVANSTIDAEQADSDTRGFTPMPHRKSAGSEAGDASAAQNGDELDEDDMVERWSQLMRQCKMAFKNGQLNRAYKIGCAALQLHSDNKRANQFVANVKKTIDENNSSRRQSPPDTEEVVPSSTKQVGRESLKNGNRSLDQLNTSRSGLMETSFTDGSVVHDQRKNHSSREDLGHVGKEADDMFAGRENGKPERMSVDDNNENGDDVVVRDDMVKDEGSPARDGEEHAIEVDGSDGEGQEAAENGTDNEDGSRSGGEDGNGSQDGSGSEEEEEEELSREDEEKYVKLLVHCRELRSRGDIVSALKAVEEALEIYDCDDRVIKLREKLRERIRGTTLN